jgi:putative endopeptidase
MTRRASRSIIARLAPFLVAAVFAASAGTAQPAPSTSVAPPRPDPLVADLDPTVDPGIDFFAYANGGWLKSNPIPPSESGWGIGNLVREEIYGRMRKISEEAAAAPGPKGSDSQKIGDFWSTAMDADRCDANGLEPLRDELARIRAARDLEGVLDAAFAQAPLGTGAFLNLFVEQDPKESSSEAVQIWQGGLGLPNRDFYFNTDDNSVRVRREYVKHIRRMLELSSGDVLVRADSGQLVMAFETDLARASRRLADLRDPEKNYHKMPVSEAARLTPSIDWPQRLKALGLGGAATVIVGQPEFLSSLEETLRKTPVRVLKDYLRYHLVAAYAPYLSRPLDEANFEFTGKILAGQQEQRPRWKRALDAEEHAIGMILGRLFVREYFPEASKKRYSALVEAVRQAYRERILRAGWMSDTTRARALDKLSRVTSKVGYPDRWKDYSALTIDRASYAENMMSAARWNFQDKVSKFGKPVDRTEWDMTPQTYNAYYNPSNNEIVLPAAAFTIPGVPDAEADDALVYGYAAASTIGHEITHGFDDEGRQFDADGNLKNWWTPEDAEQFQKRADVMVREFDSFEPLPGMHINGKASLGENIADLGGILIGLDAFKKTEQYKKGEKIGGLTPVQRFFLGYSLSWLSQIRPENLARRLLSDVHSPSKWRVIGPLTNIPEFYDAFGIKPGDPMWRPEAERVSIW